MEEAVGRFHREQQGHAPQAVQVTILDDLVVVRCHGGLTPTEESLVATEAGRKLVQSARREQRALSRRLAEAEVSRALGRPVERSFYDLDVRNGEQVEVYVLGDEARVSD